MCSLVDITATLLSLIQWDNPIKCTWGCSQARNNNWEFSSEFQITSEKMLILHSAMPHYSCINVQYYCGAFVV